jgi:mono/diheme cytochrome c family protein
MRATHRCALAAGVLALAACATARRGEPFTGEHRPPDEKVALGQRSFAANCSACHPGGQQGIGPAINDKPLPVWAIKFQVRHGLGAMPAFSDEEIPDAELDAVVKYLKWLRGLDHKSVKSEG